MALPSLSSQQIRKIEAMIEGWETKLTWDLLLQRMKSDLDIISTRQTLDTYTSIRNSYRKRKQALRGSPPDLLVKFSQQDIDMSERIKRLEAELIAANKRIAYQQNFISEIAALAKNNPGIMDIMARLKIRLKRNG